MDLRRDLDGAGGFSSQSQGAAQAVRRHDRPGAGRKGLHSVVPPRRVGGNLDVRDLSVGRDLYLPVEVAGGLFSIGDTHAAQGDGEICGTAIESAMDVDAKFDLVKNAGLKMPRFTTPGPVTRHLDAKGYEVTTGIGPDLMTGAKAASCEHDRPARQAL